jgi:hypothetical protein
MGPSGGLRSFSNPRRHRTHRFPCGSAAARVGDRDSDCSRALAAVHHSGTMRRPFDLPHNAVLVVHGFNGWPQSGIRRRGPRGSTKSDRRPGAVLTACLFIAAEWGSRSAAVPLRLAGSGSGGSPRASSSASISTMRCSANFRRHRESSPQIPVSPQVGSQLEVDCREGCHQTPCCSSLRRRDPDHEWSYETIGRSAAASSAASEPRRDHRGAAPVARRDAHARRSRLQHEFGRSRTAPTTTTLRRHGGVKRGSGRPSRIGERSGFSRSDEMGASHPTSDTTVHRRGSS